MARTADLDEMRSLMTGLFGTHRLTTPFHARPDAHIDGLEVGTLLLARVRYGMALQAEVDVERPAWTLTRVLSGRGNVDGRMRADSGGDVLVHPPDWRGRLGGSVDLQFDNLRIPTASLDAACRAMLGSELEAPLALQGFAGASSTQARRLAAMLQGLQSLPLYGGAAGRSLDSAAEQTFLLELLALWPNAYSRHLERMQPASRAVARACEFIDAHLREPIGPTEIAAAASVGVRALTLAFQKRFGVSSGQYLRQRRLDTARALLRSPLSQASVTAVASSLQFGNLGQFARWYQQRFGELPSAARRSP